jgi:cation diffusion facilitator CzcD-associated flavoprotein CzcO
MHQWQQQFAALEIPHLRSPAVHHPDPNPYALRRFAELRPDELFPPYDLPGTPLFQDFCFDVIRRWQLQERVVRAKVVWIEPNPHRLRSRFRLWLLSGQSVIARRIVLATGGGTPQLPDWVSQIQSPYPQDRLCHSQQVDLRSLQLAGERVLIIGGGLTTGHLGVGAIARGAKVLLMSRRHLQEKLFDADPGWLGPKYLKGLWAEADWESRVRLIQQARNGGSMTPAMMMQLRRAYRHDRLTFYEQCQVMSAVWRGNAWQICCDDGTEYECDRIWLATGTKLDVTAEPLLTEILDTYPIPVIKGLPVLDTHLRWSGCEVFLMGGLAGLQVGPVARNLSGARMASERIVPALRKSSIALSSQKCLRLI